MIDRAHLLAQIKRALKRSRVVALIGPRQSGKTTLAREIVAGNSVNYFDLENPASLARLEQPLTALETLRGTVVIDEIQHRPDFFPVLRVLADRKPLPARFLILGSASPELLRQSSESLAGRLETIPVAGFGLAEVGPKALSRHWQRGGFPLSFLARTNEDVRTHGSDVPVSAMEAVADIVTPQAAEMDADWLIAFGDMLDPRRRPEWLQR
jgi:predicted AAA+ superfamily ATPase